MGIKQLIDNKYNKTWKVETVTVDEEYNCFPEVRVEAVGRNLSLASPTTMATLIDILEARLNDSFIRRPTPEIKKVIFNPPATIILWMDNSKTVIKAQNGEEFDPEKGMALAICKKLFGNKGNYFNEIKKWTEPYYAENTPAIEFTYRGMPLYDVVRNTIDDMNACFTLMPKNNPESDD